MLKAIMRFFQSGEPKVDKSEYEMLVLKYGLLEAANAILADEVDRLSQENAEFKKALDNIQKADEEALQTLLKEFDMIALEAMKPIGDA